MLAFVMLLGCVKTKTVDTAAEVFAPQTGTLDESFTSNTNATGDLRIIVPDDIADGDYGVLMFFGWDGGDEYYLEEADLHEPLAAEHRLVTVSMATPLIDGSGSGCWWAPAVQDNAAFVAEFIEQRLIGELRVDPERVFLTGLSGGADFAAALPYHTDFTWGGGVVALCGGDIPRLNGGSCATEQDPEAAPAPTGLSDGVLSKVRYDFASTADDYLLENAEEAAAFYTGLGFERVRQRTVDGTGHCGFAEGWEGLDTLADGLDYVDPRVTP